MSKFHLPMLNGDICRAKNNTHTNKQKKQKTYIQSKNWGNLFSSSSFLFLCFHLKRRFLGSFTKMFMELWIIGLTVWLLVTGKCVKTRIYKLTVWNIGHMKTWIDSMTLTIFISTKFNWKCHCHTIYPLNMYLFQLYTTKYFLYFLCRLCHIIAKSMIIYCFTPCQLDLTIWQC